MSHIYRDIQMERIRQIRKWGPQHRPLATGSEAQKKAADRAKARTDKAAEAGKLTWPLVLDEEIAEAYAESDLVLLRAELIQSAAVIVAIIEDIDENHSKKESGLPEVLPASI